MTQLDESEIRILRQFLTRLEVLEKNSILKAGQLFVKSRYGTDAHGVQTEERNRFDPESFDSLLLRLRPFVLKGEPTFFHHVANIAKRNIHDDAGREAVDQMKNMFDSSGKFALLRIKSELGDLSEAWMFDLVTNAEFYHQDHEKSARLKMLRQDDFFSRDMFELSVCDRVRAVISLGRCIREEWPDVEPGSSPAAA